MIFTRWNYYRHRNFLDVKIQVLSAPQYVNSGKAVFLDIAWIFARTNRPLGMAEKIYISPRELENWSACE
jgi:hypothetical protein